MIGTLQGVSNKLMKKTDKMLTVEEFSYRLKSYFDYCDSQFQTVNLKGKIHYHTKPYTQTGLIAHIGMTKRIFSQYAKHPDYEDLVEYAMLLIENNVEEGMMNGVLNPVASIFNLKNRFAWQDKVELQQSKDITVVINQADPAVDTIELAETVDDEATMLALKEAGMNFDKLEGDYVEE